MLKTTKYKTLLALLIFGGLLLGCAGSATDTPGLPPTTPSPTAPTDLAEVEQMLDRMEVEWQARDLADYRFQFWWECFCPEGYRTPVWVTVMGGEIESVEAVEADSEIALPDRSEYRTIGGLYDLIRDAVEQNAYEIRVEYNEDLGYPASAHIDYEANIVDEERGFVVSAFESRP